MSIAEHRGGSSHAAALVFESGPGKSWANVEDRWADNGDGHHIKDDTVDRGRRRVLPSKKPVDFNRGPIFVPRKVGFGYSLNWRNPWSYLVLVMVLLGALLVGHFA